MMIDGSAKAMVETIRQNLSIVNGIVALIVVMALAVGLFLGSPVGRIVCGIFLIAGAAYAFLRWKKPEVTRLVGKRETEEDLYSQSPEANMKKLLFDDLQSSGVKYVVKEIQEEAEKIVVPSTKSVQPVVVTTKEEKAKEFQISDFFDLNSDIFRSDAEPRSEFNFLLNKALLALKEVLFAHTVAFFWANREKNQLVLETTATDSQSFMTSKRFAIETDVISQVASNGKPQLLGKINPISEKDLIRYYESTEYIKSVVAVPVYFFKDEDSRLPVGVIIADSKAEDTFGAETLGLLGNYTKLVSALIKSYTDKYDLLLDSELLSSIRRMNDRIKSDPTEFTILNSLAEEASRLVNWDFLTIAMYADEQRGWVLQKVVNRGNYAYVVQDQIVDFNESLVGKVIRANAIEEINDIAVEKPVRFHKFEKIDSDGSFLAVPISSTSRCYGALTLESRNKSNFAGNEVETIYRLVENAALALEVLYMNDLVKDFVIVDQLTGSFNKKHFMKKLEEEIQRAEDFGQELALVSLVIDNNQELVNRHGDEGFDSILNQIARIVRANIRSYDVVGRQDADGMGVLLINTTASEAYLWAEKVRKQIASHIITICGRSFSVTLSAGVCGLSEGMHKDEMIAGTTRVLSQAIEDGGNLVRVL
jgi:diguanylate cyclase (GGDEF)-like protein